VPLKRLEKLKARDLWGQCNLKLQMYLGVHVDIIPKKYDWKVSMKSLALVGSGSDWCDF